MTFHEALLQHLCQGGAIPHLSIGGALSGGALGTLVAGPMGALPGAIIGSSGGGGINQIGQSFSNASKGLVPTNNFQATTPGYTQTDYSPNMTAGAGDVASGTANIGAAINGVNANANNVAGLATGANSLGSVLAQQQGLAGQLQNETNGQGPNPAQAQFQNNTNQNIAQEAGTIASTKGINPALAARMAATNGAAQNQAAAGTAAVNQANQQLAAQSQLAGQQQAEANTIGGQANLYNAAGNLNATAGGLGNAIASQGNSLYSTAVGGQNAQNNTGVNASLGAQQINAGVAANNTSTRAGLEGGVLNAGGGVLGSALAPAAAAAHGGYGKPESGKPVDAKALSLAQCLMAMGGQVPGHAAHPGNDPRNDVVPAVLSKGEIVLPNSVTQGPNAAQHAAAFVEHLQAKAHPTYGKVLQARHALEQAKAKHRAAGGTC